MNEDKFLVTSIVSTYNSEKFIVGCLTDLANQTIFHKTEVLVVDSGSEQNESKIVQKFQEKYKNIKLIQTRQRETIYAAWNRAIRIAQGKYITNANTDDRHRKDAFEILSKELETNDSIDIVYADQLITEIPNQTFESATPSGKFSWPEFSREILLEYCCIGPQPMWRKSLHDEKGYFFDESLHVAGDYEFWLKSTTNNNTKKINKTLGLYYRSKNFSNKEFQNLYRTRYETYNVKKHALDISSIQKNQKEIFKKINQNTKLIQYLLKEPANIDFRKIQHLFWINSSYLYKLDMRDRALDFAKEIFNITDESYMISFLIKDISCQNSTYKTFNKHKVSIVIPIYNASDTIIETLDSIKNQSYTNFEIICVDDGSTDNSVSSISEWINSNLSINIKIITQKNSGTSRARNIAIKNSTSNFIIPLDADDCIANNYIEKTMSALLNADADIVFTEALFFGSKNKIWAKNDVSIPSLYMHNQVNATALFKRKCWQCVGGYDENLSGYEDWEFWISLAKSGFKFHRIPDPLFFYRHTGSGRNIIANKNDLTNKIYIMQKHHDIYKAPEYNELHFLATNQVINKIFIKKQYYSQNFLKKILFVCHNFPPYNTAGAQLFALELSKFLQSKHKNVSFFYPVDINRRSLNENTSPYAISISSYDLMKVFQINVVDSNSDIMSNPQYMFGNEKVEERFAELLEREKFHLVHFHLLYRLSARLPLVAKSMGIPTVATLHDYWLLCAMGHLIDSLGRECSGPDSPEKCARCLLGFTGDPAKDLIDFFALRQKTTLAGYNAIDRIYSPSRHLAEVHARFGFTKPEILPLGWPEVEAISATRNQADKIIFGFIGQIIYRKGLDLLVHAFLALAPDLQRRCELHIHGSVNQQHYFDVLKEKVRDNPGVKFFGPYKHEDLGRILSSFDVTVIPSRQENYPLTLLESLSAKVPVIASDVGGIREMFQDKVEGFLFKREDVSRLTTIIRILVADPSLLDAMRAKIRPIKSIRHNAEEYADIYRALIHQGHAVSDRHQSC